MMKFINFYMLPLAVIAFCLTTTARGETLDESKSASHQKHQSSDNNLVEFDKKSSASNWGKAGSMWGKRSDNDDILDEEMNEVLVKRGWEKAGSMWGKRAPESKWGKASSMWGKRAGANWGKASSMWGKRQLINNLLDSPSPVSETKW